MRKPRWSNIIDIVGWGVYRTEVDMLPTRCAVDGNPEPAEPTPCADKTAPVLGSSGVEQPLRVGCVDSEVGIRVLLCNPIA